MVLHPDDHAPARERIRRRTAGETDVYPCEARYVRLDGTHFPAEVRGSPVDFEGQPAMQFIFSDITARKQAEAIRETLLSLTTQLSSARNPAVVAQTIFAAADRFWKWDAGVLDVFVPGEDLVETVLSYDLMEGERRALPSSGKARPLTRQLAQRQELILRTPQEQQAVTTPRFGDTSRPSASIMRVPVRRQGQVVGAAFH